MNGFNRKVSGSFYGREKWAVGKHAVFCQESETVPLDQRFSEKVVRDKTGKWAEVGLWRP